MPKLTDSELEDTARNVAARLFVMDEETLGRTVEYFNMGAAVEGRSKRLKIEAT